MTIDSRELQTVAQFVKPRPWATFAKVRWQIHNADKNGLSAAGAICRIPGQRSVLIVPSAYDAWLASGVSGGEK